MPTQEDLDRVYSIAQILQQSQPDTPIVLESFEEHGMTDQDLVIECLAELQKQHKMMQWPLNAALPERKQS